MYYSGYGYGYNNPLRALLNLGGAFIFGWVLALLALYVFVRMIRWKIFTKAGEEGWKSLIPFYGEYVEYKIAWEGKWYWIKFACPFVAGLGLVIPVLGPILTVAAIIVAEAISVIFAIQEAHAFGKGDGFAVGLLFSATAFVFQILLAFDQDIKYAGPQPTPKFFNNLKPAPKAPQYPPYQQYQQPYQQPQQPQYQPYQPQFDPQTGAPVAPQAPVQEAPKFDPLTGQPIVPQAPEAPEAPKFDPNTGEKLN